jgi:uracil-DNA glycosylase
MLIINCGIKKVFCERKYHAGEESEDLLRKAGIHLEYKYREVQQYENETSTESSGSLRMPASSDPGVGLSQGVKMNDTPKSLGNSRHCTQRLACLHEPHMRELTAFVERIRRERGCGDAVPYFDPADGGVEAECLYVAEAPGPRAVQSGFISRNNPDESAKNLLELNAKAGVPRNCTVICNIVPWYVGSGGRIRPADSTDIEEGWPYLLQLLDMLPRLRIVVLVGGKAQRVASRLRAIRPDLQIMKCPHPSPMFVNRKPQNREALLATFREVAAALRIG